MIIKIDTATITTQLSKLADTTPRDIYNASKTIANKAKAKVQALKAK